MGVLPFTWSANWILGLCAVALAFQQPKPASPVANLHVSIREWDVPTKGAHPHVPAVAPDGSLWFTEQMVSKLGRLDPATGAFKEYPLKGPNDGPHGLVADRDNNIWYTGNFAAHIGKLNPRTGEVTQYKMPMKRQKIRIRRSSIRREFCGSPYKSETWSAASIPKVETSS